VPSNLKYWQIVGSIVYVAFAGWWLVRWFGRVDSVMYGNTFLLISIAHLLLAAKLWFAQWQQKLDASLITVLVITVIVYTMSQE
jgi:hypothetical protein